MRLVDALPKASSPLVHGRFDVSPLGESVEGESVADLGVDGGGNLVAGDRIDQFEFERGSAELPELGRAGRVLVSTSVDPAKAEVLIRVVDNGIGFPQAAVDRLFEPFFTSKPSGLGMGLAISRTIAESHSGRLWAQPNSEGYGATFTLAIPARPGWKPRASPAKPRGRSVGGD